MTRLGIVTGMQFEADILRAELAKAGAPDGIAVACAGPSYVSAKRVAAQLVDDGSQALLSFGIAGGLLEGLKPGTLLIANEVINWGEAIEADKAWMARLRLAIGTPRFPMEVGNLTHSDPPATTPADKRSLHIQTQALGVDMESFAVAETARAKGVPFITLRVVADESRSLLPVAALAATNPRRQRQHRADAGDAGVASVGGVRPDPPGDADRESAEDLTRPCSSRGSAPFLHVGRA